MFSFFILVLLTFNAILSAIIHFQGLLVSTDFFYLSFFIFLCLVILASKNILYFIRVLILGSIGFLAASSKILFEDALFGIHMQDSQTTEIVTIMLLMTNVALLSSHCGFLCSKKFRFGRFLCSNINLRSENISFFYISVFLFLLVSLLLDLSRGATILSGGYGDEGQEKLETGLGNLNAIANSILFFLFLLYLKFERKKLNENCYVIYKMKIILTFLVLYYVLYVNFLHGSRMDALNALFGLFVIYKSYVSGDLRVNFKIFIAGLLVFIFIQVIGVFRSTLSYLTLDDFFFLFQRIFVNLIQNPNSGVVFYQGTINDLATTFSGIIFLTNESIVDFLYGSSYLDYFFRIPPSFIYPGRPEDLSWVFVNSGFSSGGGFFELSEAYYNFGFFGALIVPFFVSFFIFYSYKEFVFYKYSIYHSLFFFAVLSVYLRGLLYQNFAFFKTVITIYILYYLIVAFLVILKGRNPLKKVLL